MVAIGLAAAGVAVSVAEFGRPPWLSLALAFSFGTYGLARKVMRAGPLPGLLFETSLLSLPALAYLHWFGSGLLGWLDYPAPEPGLLAGAGVVTAAPLLCFTFSVRRLSLVTVGIMQYLGPTCMLLLGTLAYGEPLPPARIATFALIWCGLAVYMAGAVRTVRAEKATSTPAAPR
jgi:chloramphenicol-sensitive protein RarD